MKLELRQLRYFVAVAEELNFTKAAARVFLSQPALSHQIRQLEEELSVKLFARTSRHVELTEPGRDLLDLAKGTLETLESGIAQLRRKAGVEGCLLRLGFTEYANYGLVPQIVQRFIAQHPGIRVEQIEGSTLEQITALREGHLDVGFFLATASDPELDTRLLWREPFMLALPESHPLAALEVVPFKALGGQRLIVNGRAQSPGMYNFISRLCHEAGAQPELVVNEGPHLYTFSGVSRLVASGVGAFLIVATLAKVGFPGVVFRPLADPEPLLDFVMSWRRNDPSADVRALIELTRMQVRS